MAADHSVLLLPGGGFVRPCVNTTAPIDTRVLRGLVSAPSLSPVESLCGPLALPCSSGWLSTVLSSTDDVRAAPKHGHVLTTILSRKGVPIIMVRHRACRRLGTRAVLREQVQRARVSTARCPPVGQSSAMSVRMIVGGIPATCRQPSSLSHVLTGSLAHAMRSSYESDEYVSLQHVCVLTSKPAAQLAQMR